MLEHVDVYMGAVMLIAYHLVECGAGTCEVKLVRALKVSTSNIRFGGLRRC